MDAGMIGLVRMPGLVTNVITALQLLNGAPLRYARWTHVCIALGDGTLVESRAEGAVCCPEPPPVHTGAYRWFVPQGTTQGQREAAADAARELIGTPYSYLDYVAIAASRLGLRVLARGIDAYVMSTEHMICSQLVTQAYWQAGVDLFYHKRFGDVTPADVAKLGLG